MAQVWDGIAADAMLRRGEAGSGPHERPAARDYQLTPARA
jgi:hypothetical protein